MDRLEEATRHVRSEMEGEAAAFLEVRDGSDYQRYLIRAYGFVAPVEQCLLDTPGLPPFVDQRRMRKHLLIEHDLQTLGMKAVELRSIPQCMWIPWFENVHTALGWAYILERSTLSHPNLFRHLASVLPGEAAFAATYFKAYAGATGEMWRSFSDGLDVASATAGAFEKILDGASAGYRFFRRWRNSLDGKNLSEPSGSRSMSATTSEPPADSSSEPEE